MSMRMIYCTKLKKESEGLTKPPFNNEVGEKIFAQISKDAWSLWLQHQTMLINEYRLNLIEPKSRAFLSEEMNKFLFGEGSEKPPLFVEKN